MQPLRQGDQSTLARYEEFFSSDNVVFDISSDVIDRATYLRVRYGFRSPAAIRTAA